MVAKKSTSRIPSMISLDAQMNGEFYVKLESIVNRETFIVTAYMRTYCKHDECHFFVQSFKTLEEAQIAQDILLKALGNLSLAKIAVYI